MQDVIPVKNDRQFLTKLCEVTPFTCTEIVEKDRNTEVTLYRHVIYYILRRDMGWKLKRICELMQRDHSTILRGVDKIEGEMPVYQNTKEVYWILKIRSSQIYISLAPDPDTLRDMLYALTMIV